MPLSISWTQTTTTTAVQQIFKTSSEINRVCTKLVWYGTESGCCGEIFMSMILRKCWSYFISVNMITDPCKHTFYVSHLIKNIKMRTPFLIRGTFNPPITPYTPLIWTFLSVPKMSVKWNPLIKDTLKEDKPLNKGQSKSTFVYTLYTK